MKKHNILVPGFRTSVTYDPARDCYVRMLTCPDSVTIFAIHNIMREDEEKDVADRALVHAIDEYQRRHRDPSPAALTRGVALMLDDLLRGGSFPRTWTMYCGVTITRKGIFGCTSGDIMVCAFNHLQNEGSARVSRLHILSQEDPAWVKKTYGDINMADHGSVLIRTLGQDGLPPESFAWAMTPPFTLCICSHDFLQPHWEYERIETLLRNELKKVGKKDHDLFVSVSVDA